MRKHCKESAIASFCFVTFAAIITILVGVFVGWCFLIHETSKMDYVWDYKIRNNCTIKKEFGCYQTMNCGSISFKNGQCIDPYAVWYCYYNIALEKSEYFDGTEMNSLRISKLTRKLANFDNKPRICYLNSKKPRESNVSLFYEDWSATIADISILLVILLGVVVVLLCLVPTVLAFFVSFSACIACCCPKDYPYRDHKELVTSFE